MIWCFCVGLKVKYCLIGLFLFVGLIGVGKIELIKILVEELFGLKDVMVCLDMSEYMEKYVVFKLIGLFFGYVGYEEVG